MPCVLRLRCLLQKRDHAKELEAQAKGEAGAAASEAKSAEKKRVTVSWVCFVLAQSCVPRR